ncbi:MAG: hypothetical protein WCR55_07545 [Lentisphaerota bacterium]
MKSTIIMVLCFVLVCPIVFAETDEVQPQGVYAQIDTKREMQAIDSLLNGNDKVKAQTAKEIVDHSDQYCPAVFFFLSRYFFYENKDDDAIFWLYAGRIRMWYDVKKCTDKSVEDSVDAMSAQLPDLLRSIQFENIENSKKLLKKAAEWDRSTLHNYDPAWIALHGLGAFMPNADKVTLDSLNIPKDKWAALAEENRSEYLKDYDEYFDQITPEQLLEMKKKIEEMKKEQNINH